MIPCGRCVNCRNGAPGVCLDARARELSKDGVRPGDSQFSDEGMVCDVMTSSGRYKVGGEVLLDVLAAKKPDESLANALEGKRRAGESLVPMVKAGNPQLSDNRTSEKPPDLDLTRNQSAAWQKITAMPVEKFEARQIIARYCQCGEALYGKFRFCGRCRPARNRETARIRKRRSRGVTKNHVETH